MNTFIYQTQRLLGAMVAMLVAFGSAQADSSKPEQRRFAQKRCHRSGPDPLSGSASCRDCRQRLGRKRNRP